MTICYRKKQINVSFQCVCPVIDNECRHNIVKHCQSSRIHNYFDDVMTKFMINNRTDTLKTDINLLTNHQVGNSLS